MGIQALQRFIESQCPGACVPVDLLKIARSVSVRRGGNSNYRSPYAQFNRLRLVVDGECCLDRLYGGYFSDWVCGGQWNRMVQFLSVLVQTVQNNNIDLAVFFNGSLEAERTADWSRLQQADRKKINQVIKHVSTKATPPPKVWWIPPVCLRTCLRMALRHLKVSVVCTMDDHHQEVIAFCRENEFHGLMAEDAEYAIFDPPRYFSSEQLKLTYKGSLETKEFILDEVAKSLNLHPNRFCIFAALLGNFLLTEEDLAQFHKQLNPESKVPGSSDNLISSVVEYVRALPNVENLDTVGAQIFGAEKQDKIKKLKHCVQYYLNGTKDGFLHYRPTMQGRRQETGCYPSYNKTLEPIIEQAVTPTVTPLAVNDKPPEITTWNADTATQEDNSGSSANVSPLPDTNKIYTAPPVSETSRFASETLETESSSLNAYQEATGSFNMAQKSAPQIVIEPPLLIKNDKNQSEDLASNLKAPKSTNEGPTVGSHLQNGALLSSCSSSDTSSASSPSRLSPEVLWPGSSNPVADKNGTSKDNKKLVSPSTNNSTPNAVNGHSGKSFQPGCYKQQQPISKLPKVPPEVMRTTCERHQKGLMSPWIYQILSQGELKIPVLIEDEYPNDLPPPALLFRPLRQMVYAVLFNLHHTHYMAKQKKDKEGGDPSAVPIPEVVVKEWVWNKQNQFRIPDLVQALPLDWGVPTVQRLWFGAEVDDKKRRIRAFLTCLRSDSPLILNTSYVPQHLLVLCCILRYIMADHQSPVLRKQELDAFLAQAVSPYLMNAQYTQNMQLPLVTPRGIELAALFMLGVECALFANDACGAPIPWLMCCPWLFFDGKLFHYKLLKANGAKSLVDVCDGQLEQVAKVERMRSAILEGLKVQFAQPPLVSSAPRPGVPHPGHPRFRGPLNGPPMMTMGPPGHHHPHHPHHPHAYSNHMSGMHHPQGSPNRGRGGRNPSNNTQDRRGMIARGGQLEIAGVVVGSWGANYGHMPRARGLQVPPQVTSVGGMRGYGAGGPPFPPSIARGFIPRRPNVPNNRGGKANFNYGQLNSNKKKSKQKSKSTNNKLETKFNGIGRGCTVETEENQTIFINELIDSPGEFMNDSPTKGNEDQFANAHEDSPIALAMPVITLQKNSECPTQPQSSLDGNALPVVEVGPNPPVLDGVIAIRVGGHIEPLP